MHSKVTTSNDEGTEKFWAQAVKDQDEINQKKKQLQKELKAADEMGVSLRFWRQMMGIKKDV